MLVVYESVRECVVVACYMLATERHEFILNTRVVNMVSEAET